MHEQGAGEILLKTRAFGGFEKAQVLTYIDRLREENRQAEEELGAKIAALSQTRDTLADSVRRFEGQIQSLEQQLDAKKDKICELTGVIDSLGREIDRQKASLAQRDEEIASYREATQRLSAEAEAGAEKARRYTEVAAQVGEVMVDARLAAADIIQSAREAANASREDMLGIAGRMAGEMAGFRRDVAEIRCTLDRMTESIRGRIDEVETAAEAFEKRLADTVGAAGARADAEEAPESPKAPAEVSAEASASVGEPPAEAAEPVRTAAPPPAPAPAPDRFTGFRWPRPRRGPDTPDPTKR